MENELDKNTEEAQAEGSEVVDTATEQKVINNSNLKRNLTIGLVAALILLVIILVRILNVPPNPYEQLGEGINKQELMQSEKYLSGKLSSITVNPDGTGSLTMEAHIVNVDTERDFIPANEVQLVQSPFTLSFTTNTTFENKTAQALVAGDLVNINTDSSIYLSPSLVAEKVVFYDQQAEKYKQITGNNSQINGVVKEVTPDSLIVTAVIVDKVALEKMDLTGSFSVPQITKDYTLATNKQTKVSGTAESSAEELTVGDMVMVVTDGDIYETDSLTALNIDVLVVDEEIEEEIY